MTKNQSHCLTVRILMLNMTIITAGLLSLNVRILSPESELARIPQGLSLNAILLHGFCRLGLRVPCSLLLRQQISHSRHCL